MIEALLAEAGGRVTDLDGIAFGRGPGSFTGVRIAVSVAQGIAFGADLPALPVSTLAAMAQAAWRRHGWRRVLCALDARMEEVYWGSYVLAAEGVMRLSGEELVCPPARVPRPDGEQWQGAGPGWASYGETLTQALAGALGAGLGGSDPEIACTARALGEIALVDAGSGGGVEAEQALPVYLRDRVTHQRGR